MYFGLSKPTSTIDESARQRWSWPGWGPLRAILAIPAAVGICITGAIAMWASSTPFYPETWQLDTGGNSARSISAEGEAGPRIRFGNAHKSGAVNIDSDPHAEFFAFGYSERKYWLSRWDDDAQLIDKAEFDFDREIKESIFARYFHKWPPAIHRCKRFQWNGRPHLGIVIAGAKFPSICAIFDLTRKGAKPVVRFLWPGHIDDLRGMGDRLVITGYLNVTPLMGTDGEPRMFLAQTTGAKLQGLPRFWDLRDFADQMDEWLDRFWVTDPGSKLRWFEQTTEEIIFSDDVHHIELYFNSELAPMVPLLTLRQLIEEPLRP